MGLQHHQHPRDRARWPDPGRRPGRHRAGHPAQPAVRGDGAVLRWPGHGPGPYRRSRRWHGGLHVHRRPRGHLPLRGGPGPGRRVPGRDGPLRRPRRPPRDRRPGLRLGHDRLRRRGGPRPERDRPGAEQPRQPGHLRHAQVRAPLLPRQRQGLPEHRRHPGDGREHRPAALRQRREPVPLHGRARRAPERDRARRQPAEPREQLRRRDLRTRADGGRPRSPPPRRRPTPRCRCTTAACCCTTAPSPGSAACSRCSP